MSKLWTERGVGLGLAGLISLLLTPAICSSQEAPPASSETSYGYVNASQGGVTLVEADTGESVPVEGTEAVLAGDELRLARGARAEIQLPDRNLLRLGDGAELVFLTLAGSPDRNDPVTALQLRRGSLQLVVADEYRGDAPPAVETPNAYVEILGPGTYLIEVPAPERTLVASRRGSAQVKAGRAITTVRIGEEALVEGHDGASVRLAAARGLLPVERWGESLTMTSTRVTEVYVDESIRYAAAPLRSYGTWTYVRGTRAWRPHVGSDWRPYSRGRWRHTPTGLFWVSYEPWGWVPHHYGNWDLVPGYGWVWFPDSRFASAWVFWYWGPEYVGWVPWGYYSNHYRSRFGFPYAVYGWAGGAGVHFGDWCFTPYHRFGHRDQHRYIRSGRDMGREGERIARGIITTDTRGLTPGHWTSPDRVNRLLAYDEQGKKFELEDVGPFVNREKERRLPDSWKPPLVDAGSDRARPAIDPVRTTRTVELTPTPRQPTTRDKAQQEVNRRPTPTARPNVGERTRATAGVSRPGSATRSTAARPAAPKQSRPTRTAAPRSSPARSTPRATSRAGPSKAKQD
jgi:hypothetical protein